MKILITVHHRLNKNSGAPGSTLRLAEAYRAGGHEVELMSFDDLAGRFNLPIQTLAFPWAVAYRILQGGPYDLVDASTADAWVLQRLPLHGRRRPVIVTRSHGLEHVFHDALMQEVASGRQTVSWKYPLYHGGLHLWEVAESLRRADLVVLLNNEDKEVAVQRLDVDPARILVIPNGIESAFLGLPPPKPLLGAPMRVAMVSGFTEMKGVSYALPALTRFMTVHRGATLSLLGTPAPEAQIREAFPSDIQDRLTVTERFENDRLPDLLADHNVLLFPTLSEGFGKALVEGMACGLAPIATRVAGPLDVIEDGVDGILIPPADESAIVEALTLLHNNVALRDRLRVGAHEKAQAFSWERSAELRLEAYEKAVQMRTKGG